jgi:nicotinamidase-related amidase
MSTVDVPEYTIRDRLEFDPSRTALVIVDMQKDFVDEEGALCVPEAAATVPVIGRLIEAFRSRGLQIVYTQDSHGEEDPEFELWGRHVVEGSVGEEIVDELSPLENDLIVKKPRYDAFYETDLDAQLKARGIDTLVIVGTVANICGHYTAASAALRGYRLICPVDGISALTDFDRHAHLRQTEYLFRGVLTTSDAVSHHLESTGSA